MDLGSEIITVGNELITGVQVDTNGAFLAEQLWARGIPVRRIVSVGDDAAALTAALMESLVRAPIVLLTGGLGPTADDITTAVVARALGREVVCDPDALDHLGGLLASYGLPPTEMQKKQACFPLGAEVLPNPRGTAPGFLLREGGAVLIVLPGVPEEVKAIMEQTVLPLLEREVKDRGRYQSRTLKIFGLSEAEVAERVRDLAEQSNEAQLSFLPRFPEVHLRITVCGTTRAEAEERLQVWETGIAERLSPYVFGKDRETMEEVVGKLLRGRRATLAVAESCTGGLIGHRLTNVPGSSEYLERVVVAYSNQTKIEVLKVPEEVIGSHGAVSAPTARAMAEGVRRTAGTLLGLSTTGIAGPGGGSPEKPVGTVFVCVTDGSEAWIKEYHFPGDRGRVKGMTAAVALNQVRRYLLKKGEDGPP